MFAPSVVYSQRTNLSEERTLLNKYINFLFKLLAKWDWYAIYK